MKSRFEKISRARFEKDWVELFGTAPDDDIYDNIAIPRRATKFSCGYDFFSPIDIVLGPGETVTILTGIRALMHPNQFLMLAPRSGLGCKYRIQLDNTVGHIDADYSQSENEGHICAKITNDSKDFRTVHIKAGDAFMQGVLKTYCTMDEEEVPTKERNGGFGSTDNR